MSLAFRCKSASSEKQNSSRKPCERIIIAFNGRKIKTVKPAGGMLLRIYIMHSLPASYAWKLMASWRCAKDEKATSRNALCAAPNKNRIFE